MPNQPPKLMDQVSAAIRTKHYSLRTEQTYKDWIKRYIRYHGKRHPKDMGAAEIQAFITHLAVEKNLAASTQNQALSAVLFLYRHILQTEVDLPSSFIRAQKSKTLPVVLTQQEARAVISNMSGIPQLMTQILYGSGLRLMECIRLRLKDIDFGNRQIIVRDGKGEDDRATILPDTLIPVLQRQIQTVQRLHQTDLGDGFGEVHLPYALARKYPNAARETHWQYLFPASALSVDPATKKTMHHHADPSLLQKAVRKAAQQAKINKPVSPHTFRHPPPPKRIRHPHHPGTPRTQRREDHHDLHSRPPTRRLGCQIPARRLNPPTPIDHLPFPTPSPSPPQNWRSLP